MRVGTFRALSSSLRRRTLRSIAGGMNLTPDIEEAHRFAVSRGEDTYIDPHTGYTVFTTLAAERRGKCCGRGCRHCPYGHFMVANEDNRRAPLPAKPTLLRSTKPVDLDSTGILNVLFWSGGKDSFMTYLHLVKQQQHKNTVLLTSFDKESGEVPEQKIPISAIFDQAKHLKRDLVIVPLSHGGDDYLTSVTNGIRLAEDSRGSSRKSTRVYFGDLHLDDVKGWREKQFTDAGFECVFPLFKTPYPELVKEMFGDSARALNTRYFFSAVNEDIGFNIGDELGKEQMEKLLGETKFDPFGECGEFHTHVRFS